MATKIKKYKLTHDKLSRMFGYSSPNSFNGSSAKHRILKGIEEVIKHVEDSIINGIND